LDQAKLPGGPSSPNLTVNLGIALLVGMMLAALAVFVLEQSAEGIRNPDDVAKILNLALLGNIPFGDGEPRVMLADPKSMLSEAYFSVRTTLALATSHGLPNSIVVTSTLPNEGKSITALALAVTIGRT